MNKNLISQDILDKFKDLQKYQNCLSNIVNTIYDNDNQMYKESNYLFENVKTYTLEDFKNDLLPILNNFNKRLEILGDNYNIVNNI